MVCCPLSNDGGDCGVDFFESKIVKAAKPHKCCECGDEIPVGTKHEYAKGRWEGDWSTFRSCLSCVEIRDHFACGNGWLYECVWEDIEQNFFPDMKAGGKCMDGLSPAAKERLFTLRLEWMFDSELEIDGAPPPGHEVDPRSGKLVKADPNAGKTVLM